MASAGFSGADLHPFAIVSTAAIPARRRENLRERVMLLRIMRAVFLRSGRFPDERFPEKFYGGTVGPVIGGITTG